MSLYINVASMLHDYGVDIKVWDASKIPKGKRVAGILQPVDLDKAEFESRHEPVLPFSANSAGIVAYLSGGAQLDVDLLWLSTGSYPKNTIVEVPSQGGRYRVTGLASYQDYSDLTVYQLKGDDEHSDTGR